MLELSTDITLSFMSIRGALQSLGYEYKGKVFYKKGSTEVERMLFEDEESGVMYYLISYDYNGSGDYMKIKLENVEKLKNKRIVIPVDDWA